MGWWTAIGLALKERAKRKAENKRQKEESAEIQKKLRGRRKEDEAAIRSRKRWDVSEGRRSERQGVKQELEEDATKLNLRRWERAAHREVKGKKAKQEREEKGVKLKQERGDVKESKRTESREAKLRKHIERQRNIDADLAAKQAQKAPPPAGYPPLHAVPPAAPVVTAQRDIYSDELPQQKGYMWWKNRLGGIGTGIKTGVGNISNKLRPTPGSRWEKAATGAKWITSPIWWPLKKGYNKFLRLDPNASPSEQRLQLALHDSLNLAVTGMLFGLSRWASDNVHNLGDVSTGIPAAILSLLGPIFSIASTILGVLLLLALLQLLGHFDESIKKALGSVIAVVLGISGIFFFKIFLNYLGNIHIIDILEITEVVGLHWLLFAWIVFVFIFMAAMPQYKWARRIILLFFLAFVIFGVFFSPLVFGDQQWMAEKIGEDVLYAFGEFLGVFGVVTETYERAVAMASGDWYIGEVDENAEKNLGVKIEKVKSVGELFDDDEQIQTYAIISAEAIGDKPVKINLMCYSGDHDEPGMVDGEERKTIEVTSLEKTEADCVINASELDIGMNKIYFEANFNFSTQSYYKTYFMRRSLRRQYEKQGIDPFEEAKIADKKPVSKYTDGPLGIGIGTQMTPPISLPEGIDRGPTFGVTFENKWGGELGYMSRVYIVLPRGMGVTDINGEEIISEKVKFVNTSDLARTGRVAKARGVQCLYTETSDVYCMLDEEILFEILGDEGDEKIRTMRISTEVTTPMFMEQPAGGEAIIKPGRIGVTADYEYKLKRSTEVRVRESRS
jgi:hypothetical protein